MRGKEISLGELGKAPASWEVSSIDTPHRGGYLRHLKRGKRGEVKTEPSILSRFRQQQDLHDYGISRSSRFRGVQTAFTLIEVVVAVAIIAVMFVTLYLGISFGFATTRFERENLRATQIILERMEGFRLMSWTQISDVGYNPVTFTSTYYPSAGGGQSQGIVYTGTVTIVDGPTLDPAASYSGDMKKITVTVNWASGSVQRSRTLNTYIARNGLQNYIYAN